MNQHGTPQPFGGPVPDLAAIAQQQVQAPRLGVGLQAVATFNITVPYNASAQQRSQAASTARKLIYEFATGQSPPAEPAQ